jgi:hypothetical protein
MKNIKILWSWCPNCVRLENNVKLALEKSWIEANLEKVTDIWDIISYWIMSTPWLVIDEKVISSWKINEVDEIVWFLKDNNCCSSWDDISEWCCSDKDSCNISCTPKKEELKTQNFGWCSCWGNC